MRSGGMRSGGFGGFKRSGPTSRSTATTAPPPRTVGVDRRPGVMGGLGSTIMQGMAFGAGSEIGHSAVRGAMGGSAYGHSYSEQTGQPTQQMNTDPCKLENENFLRCLQNNQSDISACQSMLDLFKQCRGQV